MITALNIASGDQLAGNMRPSFVSEYLDEADQ
jgi:hypothetical protein